MRQFAYKALDKNGVTTSGTIESSSVSAAARTLQDRKLLVINVTQKQILGLGALSLFKFNQRVSERDIATFTRLLSTMLSTGLPLTDALSNMVTQTKSTYFREVLTNILHDIQSGVSLSESMGRTPNVFDALYVNIVKAGEASGKVDEALAKLADTLESNLDFKGKVSGAMVYPAVVTVAMGGIGVFMMTSIIPKIADVYKEFGGDLPGPTKFLMAISNLMTHYTIVVVIAIGLIWYLIRTLRKNPASDYMLNNLALKLPVFGELTTETTLAVVTRTLGTLLSSGVAILDALQIVSKTVANNKYRAGILGAASLVERGMPLSLAMRRNPDFPQMVSQLVAIGEETGTLDKSLDRLAQFYQDAAERKVKVLTTLLEPMMIMIMGGMVGGLAIAVLLPMFNLVNVIK